VHVAVSSYLDTMVAAREVKGSAEKPINSGYLSNFLQLLYISWPLLLGNTLEWYEFGVYGYVEKDIAANFFDGSAVGGWLGFAVTFAARPLGGFVLGWIADNWGRKTSVNLSLAGMIIGTVGQGLLPGKYWGSEFRTLGLVLLVMTRALQGISAGGEIGAISCYMMEVSPIATLGMAVAQISIGSQIAWAFASGFLAYLRAAIGNDAMLVWGWRVPFVISIVPGIIALWGRNRIQETEVFLEEVADISKASDSTTDAETSITHAHKSEVGILHLLKCYWPNLVIGFGGSVGIATMWFVPPFWTLSAVLAEHLGPVDSLWVGNSAQLVGLCVTPLAGWLADTKGVAWTMLTGAGFFAATGLPVYMWLSFDPASTVAAYVGVGFFFGAAQGYSGATIYLFVAELFPAKVRGQGIASSYNLAISFVGGFGSMICQALFVISPHLPPGLWFSGTGFVSVITVVLALLLQKRGCVQLTHRRSAPYFGSSKAAVAVDDSKATVAVDGSVRPVEVSVSV